MDQGREVVFRPISLAAKQARKMGKRALGLFNNEYYLNSLVRGTRQKHDTERQIAERLPAQVRDRAQYHQLKIVAHIQAVGLCRALQEGTEPVEDKILGFKETMLTHLPKESLASIWLDNSQIETLANHVGVPTGLESEA